MKKLGLLSVLLFALSAQAQYQSYTGLCSQGATAAVVSGLTSSNLQESAFRSCTVTVYLTGTGTLASLFSTHTGTALPNPFTALQSGVFTFYASPSNNYDISMSAANMVTTTIPYVSLGGGGGGGSGTVTNVSTSGYPTPFGTVAITNPTTTPLITFAAPTYLQNFVLAGPTSGSGNPTARLLVPGDLPQATSSTFGTVKPDNSTITISGGVISAPGGGGAVSSVSNGDGSLTVSPTTGGVVASLNTGHANNWTAQQTFSGGTYQAGFPNTTAPSGLSSGNQYLQALTSDNKLHLYTGATDEGSLCSAVNGQCAAVAGSLTDNLLLNSPTTGPLFCETDSIGLPQVGGFCQTLAANLSIPSGNRFVNNIGSASMADMLSCNNAGCTQGGLAYQYGAFPLTFPLGVVSNSKTVIEFGYNELSNMGGTPSSTQLSYMYGQLKGWMLEFGTLDSQKLAANGAYCTTTGTWTAVSAVPGGAGTFPAGTVKTSTPGATMTCTGYNATDAGFIGYKSTGSTTATFTVSVINAGTTYNVSDPYTGSTTLNQTAAYTSSWGGTASLYAIGQGGMGGGYTTVTLTAASNGSDPVIVVAPYFVSPSANKQNAPAVEIALSSRAGCDGTCSTVSGSLHTDANTNIIRAAQIAAVNELRGAGMNATYFDPNATPNGYNSSDTTQTTKLTSFDITGGGSGFSGSTSTPTITGCTINPIAAPIPISAGALVTGTYYPTSEGSCLGATITITFSGSGSGATYTSAPNSDGTHPNQAGSNNFAAVALPNLNSAVEATDHLLATPPSSGGGCTNNCTFTGQTLLSGGSTQAPLIVRSSSSTAGGTVLGLQNTAAGGHNMGLYSNTHGEFLVGDGTTTGAMFATASDNSSQGYFTLNHAEYLGWKTTVTVTGPNVPDTALTSPSVGIVNCGDGSALTDKSCRFSAAQGNFVSTVLGQAPSTITGNVAGTLGVWQNTNTGGIVGYSINDNVPTTQGIFGFNTGYAPLTNTVGKFFFLAPTSPICFITVVGGSACDLNIAASQGGATFGVPIKLLGSTPAVSSCGGGTIVAGSTDNSFQVTGIAATTTVCTVTFHAAVQQGFCTANAWDADSTVETIAPTSSSTTSVLFSIGTPSATFGQTISAHCF